MRIEIIYNGEGDVMINYPDEKAEYFYTEYDLPEELIKYLESNIPKYGKEEI